MRPLHTPAALAAIALIAFAAPAPAQQAVTLPSGGYTDAARELLPHGVGLNRSEELVLGAVAEMDAPPDAIATIPDALLTSASGPAWDEATAWAGATPQRAALDALKKATDPATGHAFALPYGAANTPRALVDAGLFNELLVDDLLVTVDHAYLRGLDELFILASVEAERLAQSGDAAAPFPLVHWVLLARQVADQPFFREKLWAMRSMRLGLERLRDLLYTHPRLLTEQQVIDLVRELDPRAILIDRIAAPQGDRLAAQQLIAQTYVERRGPDPARFSQTLARLGAAGRPLRLFGEAAFYAQVAATQADYYEAIDAVDAVFNDWALRWDVPHTDPIWTQPTDFSRLDAARFTLLTRFTPDAAPLFSERRLLRTDLLGTRYALSAVGYWNSQRVWPTDLPALRPRFFASLDDDPFDLGSDRFRAQPREPLRFFVPIRDQRKGPRDEPPPHKITLRAAGAELRPLGHTDGASAADVPPPSAAMLAQSMAAQAEGSIGAIPPEELRAAMARVLEFLANSRIDASNVREQVQNLDDEDLRRWQGQRDVQIFSRRLKGEVLDPAAPPPIEPEMDVAARRAALADYLERVLSNPAFVAVLERFGRDTENISTDAARTAFLAMLEPSIRAQAEEIAPTLIRSQVGAQEFTVALNDTVFVLYSKGPDGKADWARSAGPGGSDILLWPPVLSLLRADINGTDPLAPWKR